MSKRSEDQKCGTNVCVEDVAWVRPAFDISTIIILAIKKTEFLFIDLPNQMSVLPFIGYIEYNLIVCV